MTQLAVVLSYATNTFGIFERLYHATDQDILQTSLFVYCLTCAVANI